MPQGEHPVKFGAGEQSPDFCYIDTVLNATYLAADAPRTAGEVVNIACGERTTLNAIVADLNRLLWTHVQPEYRPTRAGDVKHSLEDISEAQRVLGYRPQIMFAEGLER
jgi:nucleoside-diphosphate-sugar epimerase